jgi:alginate O-acetyltransferase complex protein AlgF
MTSKRTNLKALLSIGSFCAAALAAQNGRADDQGGLYAAPPPPNSAYVRIISAGSLGKATVGPLSLAAAPGGASPYRVIVQGKVTAKAGATVQALQLTAGHFYSVVLGPGSKITLLDDPAANNKAKALIVFYNLTDRPLDLRTADGGTKVIEAVAPGRSGLRLVNAAAVGFSTYAAGGQAALAKTASQTLVRGVGYSAIAVPKGGGVALTWQRAEVK